MAKLSLYTLNSNGTIPDYVIDGGYYSSSYENNFPQHIKLLGIIKDIEEPLPETCLEILDENSLRSYLTSILPETENIRVESINEIETETGVETLVTENYTTVPVNIDEKVNGILDLLGKYS